MSKEPARGSGCAVDGVLLATAILAGAVIRILPAWSAVFSGKGAVFFVADPWYHMRRIQFAVRHFPTIIDFDPYVNFPGGAPIYWPGGFDLLLASAARFLTHGSPDAVERFCALAIPVLGVIAVVTVYTFTRASLGRPAAGAAALAYALLPFPVAYSLLGYVDHHVTEPIFLAAAAALWVSSLGRKGWIAAGWGAAAGAIASLSNAFVTDGIAIVVLLCVLATWEALRGRFPGARPSGLALTAAATVTIFPLAAVTPWGRSGTMTYLALSPLQTHLAVMGLGIAAALILGAWRGFPRPLRMAGAILGMAVTAAAVAHGGRELLHPLREAAGFLGREEAIASAVGESMPVWGRPWRALALILSPVGIVAAPALAWAILRDRTRPAGSVAILALAVFAMGLAQMRFLVLGGVGTAFAAGWLVALAWRARAGAPRPPALRAGALGLLAAMLAVPHVVSPFRGEAFVPEKDALDLSRALDALHGPGTDPLASLARPPWGVVGTGDLGHLLIYRAGAASVSTPFGQAPWHIEGTRRAIRFTFTESDRAAADLCRRLRVRYVYTNDPFVNVAKDAEVLGVPVSVYVASVREGGGWSPTAMFLRTVRFRLHALDGSAVRMPEEQLPALPSFRLVWESEGSMGTAVVGSSPDRPPPARYKLFEVVRGAVVKGRCVPDEPVRISVPVATSAGRRFEWWDEIRCGSTGRYALRTPNPSPDVRVTQGTRKVSLAITEHQVREGDLVEMDLLGP